MEKEQFTQKMYRLLEERAGMTDLGKHVVVEHIYTPLEWRRKSSICATARRSDCRTG